MHDVLRKYIGGADADPHFRCRYGLVPPVLVVVDVWLNSKLWQQYAPEVNLMFLQAVENTVFC